MKIMHVALLVADLERAAHFYEGLLGLVRIARPDLGFAGIWYGLEAGQRERGQHLHLMQLPNPYQECDKPVHGGRDQHLALQVDNLAEIQARLEAAGIAITYSKSGRAALFCRDPDGNTLELIGA